ncbi:hypothetical protein DL237_11860 [Pseudooceanicola sediminis]|uniref:Uncharacterized protein n=1 Tax=Pseudooceanicola sediminis TaxID=2211117 RepID=A0A399J1P1_9RHOB|nr:hypothetical protein [Pseudooceanicola sediminis]KAA2313599.1 hypothetical protein E0K93_13175 [Puniceibacterium sp. HSS470]RII38557.1 hypothetical protein DL237_11860 [Pseudooceanicola sediminis]|tara:strand:+ start:2263 stop:2613 length:351 start_codon:yes stop_codon:yes gene_type:complete
MTTYLPKDITDGLVAARKMALRKASRLRVEADGSSHKVLRRWENGFSVDAADAPHLRGLVELFDGATFIASCLIIASAEEEGEMQYEFKRSTAARDHAPLDFQQDEDAPFALLGKS